MATEDDKKPAGDPGADAAAKAAADDKARADSVAKRIAAAEAAGAQRALREALAGLGDVSSLDEVKERLAAAANTQTEAEKSKAALDKIAKEKAKLEKEVAELAGFRTATLKTRAIMEHATKTCDPELLIEVLSPKLAIDDKGAVVGPEGKTVAVLVDELLAAKEHLRAPGFKAGAGTSGKKPKPAGDGAPPNGGPRRLSLQEATKNFADQLMKSSQGGEGSGP